MSEIYRGMFTHVNVTTYISTKLVFAILMHAMWPTMMNL